MEAGDQLLQNNSSHHFESALKLLSHESYQARMLGTYLLGELSADNKKALEALRTKAAKDGHWRVQEMLAKAFDQYCKTTGYEKSMPVIKKWLADKNPNVNRAVVEGLRSWTGKPSFRDDPSIAIKLISGHKSADGEYVRKSVGNALRDIRKKYKSLVDQEIESRDLSNSKIASTRKKIG